MDQLNLAKRFPEADIKTGTLPIGPGFGLPSQAAQRESFFNLGQIFPKAKAVKVGKDTTVVVSPTEKVAGWQGMHKRLLAGKAIATAPTRFPLKWQR